MEEASETAAAILRDAGWKPHNRWSVYTSGPLVMGFDSTGSFHVKNIEAVQEGDAAYSADTPDMHEEAAAWLVARFASQTGAPIEAAIAPESLAERVDWGDDSADETYAEAGETNERSALESAAGDDGAAPHPAAGVTALGAVDGSGVGDSPAGYGETSLGAGNEEHSEIDEATAPGGELFGAAVPGLTGKDPGAGDEVSGKDTALHGAVDFTDDPIDADFSEPDAEPVFLETDDLAEAPALEFSAEMLEAGMVEERKIPRDDTPQPQDRFIGLDDLDRVKRLRIGDVAAAAVVRVAAIETEAAEKVGEYAALQAYVVTNLDEHTGAFTLQDEASRKTFDRYMVLETARKRVFAIDTHRKAATAYLLDDARTREEIVAFEPEAGWPT